MDQTESLKYLKEQHPEAISKRLKATSGVVKVPIQLLTDKRIRHPPSIILYGMLVGMSNKYDRLTIGNSKLMEWLGVKSPNTITSYLKELKSAGYISISYAHTGKLTARQIKIPSVNKKNYISIPNEVLRDRNLLPIQKLILAVIYTQLWRFKSLTLTVTNQELSSWLQCPQGSIKNNVWKLTKKGHLFRNDDGTLSLNLKDSKIEEVTKLDRPNWLKNDELPF